MPASKRKQAVLDAAPSSTSEPDLAKMKVTELREELTKLGLSTSGNKAELVARLREQSTAPPPKKAKEEDEEEKDVEKESAASTKSDKPAAAAKNNDKPAEKESGGDQKPAEESTDAGKADPAKMKVAELKVELTTRGLDTSGNKAALVARLVSALAGSAAATGTTTTAAPPQEPATALPPAPEKKGKKGAKGKKVEEEQPAESAQEETDFSKAVKALGSSAPKKKKRQAKVDTQVPGGAMYTVVDDWDCMLNQTNIGQNNNKFYVIQLLKTVFGSSYTLWTRWGRVGEPGQNKMDHCSGLEDGTKSFCKKFKDKTQNAWEDRHNFQPRSGKYTLLEMDDDDEDAEEVVAKLSALDETDSTEKVVKQCTLDKPTQALIKLIFDNDMFQEAMKSMEIDTKKMPLGKLSKGQIAKGFTALEAIEQAIKDKASRAELAKLCSTFYTIIPHAFGRMVPPVIADAESLQKKFDMLLVLGDIELAQGMQQGQEKKEQKSADGAVPHPLDVNYQSLNARLSHIAPTESVYNTIKQYVDATGPTYKKLEILDVWEVDRQTEGERFSEHDKVDNRRLLWHGTNVAVVAAILKSGLRIMPHSGGRVGRGIYFASENSKSAAYVRCAGNTGIMFLNEVALGKEHHITMDDSSLVAPPKGFESVVAKGRTEPDSKLDTTIEVNGKTVVVPQGKPIPVPQYNNSSFSQSEYLVYKESQCRIRYLLKLKF